jgi:hypothetical protein
MTATIPESTVAPTVEPLEFDVIEVEPGKIDPSLKQVFVTALRSGKYEQTYGWFRKEGAYCALGVLLDTQGFDMPLEHNGYDGHVYGKQEGWDKARDLVGEEAVDHIWQSNDSGTSFPDLAAWVEENL